MQAAEISNSVLTGVLREKFGFATFRPGQLEAISDLFACGRLLCIQPTGHGKSLLYQLPTLLLSGVTLVISPLLALMRDQLLHLNTRFHIPAASINSDQTLEENTASMNAAVAGDIQILFISPEQMDDADRFRAIANLPISLLVIDEAHCISTWGHDFRPSYRQIIHLVGLLEEKNHDIKILALTATADEKTAMDIKQQLSFHAQVVRVHRASMARSNIQLCVIPVTGTAHKLNVLIELLPQLEGCGLIYCATRENTELVAEFLSTRSFNAIAYHAGLNPEEKPQIQNNFLENNYAVVAATNALGMGIDKANLRFIIHYDMPGSITAYYQEIGRCGRDGLPAQGILLFDHADKRIQQHFIDSAQPMLADFQLVLNVINNAEESLGLMDVKRLTGLHPTRVTVVIAELLEQNYLCKAKVNGKQVYRTVANDKEPDLSRYANQYQMRTSELKFMLNYGEEKKHCLMQLLRQHLGDVDPECCNNCSVCKQLPLQAINGNSQITTISQWLNKKTVTIDAAKTNAVLSGIAVLNGTLRSKYFIEFMRGRAESNAEQLNFSDELFDLVKKQLEQLKQECPFSCIMVIPSRTWGARDAIAGLLAKELAVPVFLDMLQWREFPVARQGELLNNDQRRYNVEHKMSIATTNKIPQGTILLFDDYIGSGATIKEAARALRKEGYVQNKILPFMIAAVKWRLGRRGMV